MTRDHRLLAIATKTAVNKLRFQRTKRPNLTGTIRQCLDHGFTKFMTSIEKHSLVNSITKLLIDSIDSGDEIADVATSGVADMVQQQQIKVRANETVTCTHYICIKLLLCDMYMRIYIYIYVFTFIFM